jgi:phospholipase C
MLSDDLTRPDVALPNPGASGLEHVVVVTMENRSFDHFLGWLPAADGRQAGLAYPDRSGVEHPTYGLAPDYQGCGHPNPDHSYRGGRVTFNDGACDGWLKANADDPFSIGYYTQSDLGFLGTQAPYWTVCDRYFASIMAETLPNRLIQHAGQTDRLGDTPDPTNLPTIWDRLAARGVSHAYYYSDVPVLALWGARYLSLWRHVGQFIADCRGGNLPSVAYVDPPLLGQFLGISGDDHPPSDIRNGEVFLDTIYRAVTTSPAWPHTLLVITFDEWGGFFDHVPPTPTAVSPLEYQAGNIDGLRGFRVPGLLISPWSRRQYVAHEQFDHASILKLIEWRWGLAPLTVRDDQANNLALALDFAHPNLTVPQTPSLHGRFGGPCLPSSVRSLANLATRPAALILHDLAAKLVAPTK